MTTAFQVNAFQNSAFQITPSFSVDAFQKCAFQFGAFQTSPCSTPEETVRSGVWRLNLYKLQEDSERKRKEKNREIISEAVEKVTPKTPAKKIVKLVQAAPPVERKIPARLAPEVEKKVDYSFMLMQQAWAIMGEVTWWSEEAQIMRRVLEAKVEYSAEEDDIELLLLAA